MRIVMATGNPGKLTEFKKLLEDLDMEILTMREIGLNPGDIVEDGTTFEENARKKAEFVGAKEDTIVIADDSGLEIDALGGEPGIYSARYLGEDTPQSVVNATVVKKLEGLHGEERACRFHTFMVVLFPDGEEYVSQGTLEGQISEEVRGEGGFGYDPVFYMPAYGLTMAELGTDFKNTVSHRSIATKKAAEKIREWLDTHSK